LIKPCQHFSKILPLFVNAFCIASNRAEEWEQSIGSVIVLSLSFVDTMDMKDWFSCGLADHEDLVQ